LSCRNFLRFLAAYGKIHNFLQLLAGRFSISCGFLRLDFQLLVFRKFLRVNRKNKTFLLLVAACMFLQTSCATSCACIIFGLYCSFNFSQSGFIFHIPILSFAQSSFNFCSLILIFAQSSFYFAQSTFIFITVHFQFCESSPVLSLLPCLHVCVLHVVFKTAILVNHFAMDGIIQHTVHEEMKNSASLVSERATSSEVGLSD